MSKDGLAVVILAAGKGTRMKSIRPKVLHEIGGAAMIAHVIRTVEKLKPAKIVVVVGPGMEDVAASVKPYPCAVQKVAKGTGDAVRSALSALEGFKGNDVLILYGDTPLVAVEALKLLIEERRAEAKIGICVAGMFPAASGGYGRLVLNDDGSLNKIVEAKDATKAEKEISFCNAGFMCVDAKKLPAWIGKIKNSNAQKEFYLTDLPAIAAAEGFNTVVAEVSEESAMGVNDRADLAMTERIFQDRRRMEMLEAGVTMTDPASVYFSWDTKIANDVTIEPGVFFGLGVCVEAGAVIKAYSHIEGAVIGAGATVGPFARLRPGTDIGADVKIGNFVEIKKSKIGHGSKISHLAYVGDAAMGADVNFGCGAITVNYDGFDKHKTVIKDGAMIGSNVSLIAPVTVNEGAFVAAGSTVTEDVPAHALSIGRERPKVREGWAAEFRKRKAGVKKVAKPRKS